MVGEMALIEKEGRFADAVAFRDVLLYKFPRENFLALLRSDAEFGKCVLANLAHEIRATAQKLAGEFAAHYAEAYGHADIAPAVAAACPGR